MGFFNALRKVLGGHASENPERAPDPDLARAWGLDEAEAGPEGPRHDEPSAYDRAQWVKRLGRILGELPDSKREWADLMADAKALHFDPAWIREREQDEFRMLVRRAVADRKFTEEEHRALDQARDLMGIPVDEAVSILNTVVAEAEAFFGRSVDKG